MSKRAGTGSSEMDAFSEIEVQHTFGSLANLIEHKVTIAACIGTVNLAAVGVAFSARSYGVVFLAAALAIGGLWIEFKSKASIIFVLERLIQFSNRYSKFPDDGFLWGLAVTQMTEEEVEELRAEATALCRGECGPIRGVTPAAPDETDDDVLQRYLCIHFPHKLSPTIHNYLGHHAIVEVLTQVIGPDVKCMQSMLFIKKAGKPGQAWHQDEDFIPTRDRSLTGAWMALDDATVENGCLWVIPGSHKRGLLWPQREHDDPTRQLA